MAYATDKSPWAAYADQMHQARLEQALGCLFRTWAESLCGRSPGGHPLILDADSETPEVCCPVCDFYPPVQMSRSLRVDPIRVILEEREDGVWAIPIPPKQEPCIWHD